jgi:hypothetical protein
LNIPLKYNLRKGLGNIPSLDRIRPERGYTKGNIWVISNRANTLKNNATLEELELLVKNLRKKIHGS